MRTHSHHFVWLVGFASLVAVATAFACSCSPSPPPKEALTQAAAVFSGTVTEIAPWSREVTIGGQNRPLPMKRVTFRVIETWKGTNTENQIIFTGIGGGDCGYEFVKGSNYLVYAYQSRQSNSTMLTTSLCTRTRDTSAATDDFRVLGVGEKLKMK